MREILSVRNSYGKSELVHRHAASSGQVELAAVLYKPAGGQQGIDFGSRGLRAWS
jgi:hypothetical protein